MYIVNLNTPLEKLPEFAGLSARSRNLCRRQSIMTIGKLLNTSDSVLMRYKNCGVRCVYELQGIKMKYGYLLDDVFPFDMVRSHEEVMDDPDFWLAMERSLDRYYEETPPEIVPLLQQFVGDIHGFVEFLNSDNLDILSRIKDLSWSEFCLLRPYLEGFLGTAIDNIAYYDKSESKGTDLARRVAEEAPMIMVRHLLGIYPHVVTVNFRTKYLKNFQNLPTRTRNVFGDLGDFDKCLPYLAGARDVERREFPGCGVTSFAQFADFLKAEREVFNSTLADLKVNRNLEYYLEEYCNKYCHLYPFLSREEQVRLANMEIIGEPLPKFSIWRKYLLWHSSTAVEIMRDHIGLNDDHRKYSVEELRERHGMSNERVRQICIGGVADDVLIHDVKQAICDSFREPAYSASDPCWQQIISNENMDVPVSELMGMVTLAQPDFELVTLNASLGVSCIINRLLMKRIRLKNVVSTVERTYLLKHFDDITVDVRDMMQSLISGDMTDNHVDILASLVAECFLPRPGVELTDDGALLFRHNAVNKIKEIEEILRRNGKPMSLAEIYERYNQEYPDDKINKETSLHSYLLRNPEIVPLGKRGLYALHEWPSVYRGCIKDYIPEVLEASKVPLSIDQLTERVREVFPDTNEKSIQSLLYLDVDRYVLFENNHVGLASRVYPEWETMAKRIFRRASFDDRFNDFRSFVQKNGRLPYANEDKDESTLDRWRKNVLGGKVESTEEQRRKLRDFIESAGSLPRNGTEYRFFERCKKMREVVSLMRRLPKSSEYPHLYIWFRKAINNRGSWHDNRDGYMEDLLSWLIDTNVIRNLASAESGE